MDKRMLLALPVGVFIIVGAIGYVAGMPKPAAMVSELSGANLVPAAASVTILADGTVAQAASAQAGPVTIDQDWLLRTGAATGIPVRALTAYATAAYLIGQSKPECGLGWNTVAAIGDIESQHGSHDGAQLQDDGTTDPLILGPALDGHGVGMVPDTDRGQWDGDTRWDRAVGPMQFIPSTWAAYGVDANGDGVADAGNIDDASLAAAAYLCEAGALADPDTWNAAVFSYNHDQNYVDAVRARATSYAQDAPE